MRPARQAFFPLDEQLEVWEQGWSEHLAKQAVWLSGLVTFEQAEEILSQVGQIEMSDSTIWRLTQSWGERFKALEQLETAQATLPPAAPGSEPGQGPRPALGVAMDGAKVHLRQDGWKELKVGCVFGIQVLPTLDPPTGDLIDLAHAVHITYVAHLGGPERFGQLLWAEAQRRDWMQVADTQVLGDGAPWIWNLARDYFYTSRQAVDWYHAQHHLSQAANLICPEGSPEASRWLKQQEARLFEGHADQIATTLAEATPAHLKADGREALRREAGYFRENYRRMQYLELREEGWLMGSGVVESACKQFRGRFVGPGMQWSRPRLENLLPVRAAIMGKRFEAAWRAVYKSPRK